MQCTSLSAVLLWEVYPIVNITIKLSLFAWPKQKIQSFSPSGYWDHVISRGKTQKQDIAHHPTKRFLIYSKIPFLVFYISAAGKSTDLAFLDSVYS